MGKNIRKTLLFTAIMLLFTTSGLAQQLGVKNFRLLENDLTAKWKETAEKDQNGELAALIRIVSPERGFEFEGGSLGIVGTRQKTGETWLYIPGYTEKITIKHQDFGVLRDYRFPIPVEGGRTYEMLLDIGTGRYVTITSSVVGSDLYIDEHHIGTSPCYNVYLNYGVHTLRAVGEKKEGTMREVVQVTDEQQKTIHVEMEDVSNHFGDVVVSVSNQAEILFQGRRVGTGKWTTTLREGRYSVQTFLPDCDTIATSFTVEPMKVNNIEAKPPTPHTGYLVVVPRTHKMTITSVGNREYNMYSPIVPVGHYQLRFSRKGYKTVDREYDVWRNKMTTDTVTLEHKEYFKKRSLYFGVGYSLSNLSGISGIVGAVFHNNDIQFSYTFGLTHSKDVSWYDSNGLLLSTMNYRQDMLSVKYGWQFTLLRQLALTPQLGYVWQRLGGQNVSGSKSYGSGASAHALSVGFKFVVVPYQHFFLFVAPEYNIAMRKSKTYSDISSSADFSANHFTAVMGVLINF